jgi:hypothetical protein
MAPSRFGLDEWQKALSAEGREISMATPTTARPRLADIAGAQLPGAVKRQLRGRLPWVLTHSIRAAAREQGLTELMGRLESLVPDIRHQYSEQEVDAPLLVSAVRSLHAFQISLASAAIREIAEPGRRITVVDIGDSAGTHLRYLEGLLADLELVCVGINLDPDAVSRIRSHGIDALECRAEELAGMSIDADVFLSFETLEHLTDPVRTLKSLSYETSCERLVITVPYVTRSRLGLYHIRNGVHGPVGAEGTHIFELSPPDWRLLVRHAGWSIDHEQTYLQYPRRSLWRITKPVWARTERWGGHEGFWGAVLRRDHSWSDLYADW